MITEQYIDEGIVPMNMGWRAGIGQNTDSIPSMDWGATNIHSQIQPRNGSVNSPWNQEDPLLPGKEDLWDGGIRLTYSKDNTNKVEKIEEKIEEKKEEIEEKKEENAEEKIEEKKEEKKEENK